MDSVRERLRVWDLLRVFLRLLFLQGLLNRRGMQNLGVASALSPVSGKLTGEGENPMLMRHLSFFNSNPNCVPLIMGGVIRLEEERLSGKPVDEEDIERFRKALAGPLAAMGDMLLLGNVKPLALTFACIFAIYNFPIGLLAIFLLYNIAIVSCRLWGVYFGYAKGWELVDVLSSSRFQKALTIAEVASAGVGGVLLGVLLYRFPENRQSMVLPGVAVAAVTVYLLRRDIPASWIAIILLPICAFIALLLR